jgi:diguanylate cyclase (GGDEF)-like protein
MSVAIYSWRRQSVPGATAFALLTIFEAEWTLTYVLQMISPSLDAKLFWNNAQFIGAIITPITFLGFSLRFTGRSLISSRRFWFYYSIFPFCLLTIIFTDGMHHLFRLAPHVQAAAPVSILIFGDGPLFWLYPIWGYATLLAGAYFLISNYLSSPRIYRFQVATLGIGILIPWITTIITMLNLVPYRLHDVTPLMFGVSNLVVAWALFRYRLFDIVPVARASLVEGMSDGVVVIDPRLRIIDYNPAAQHILNLPRRSEAFLPAENYLAFLKITQDKLGDARETLIRVETCISMDELLHHYEVDMTRLFDNSKNISGLLVILRDITERKIAEEQLQRLAIIDPLTNHYNRRYFFDLAQREFERARRYNHPLSIILIDVDDFKKVNDRHGHQVGDQVLSALTNRCKDCLRAADVLARYGGEEFAILLPETASTQANQVAERIRKRVNSPDFETSAGPVRVTISLGIAQLTDRPEETLDSLIDQADQALYLAKNSGRNQVREKETEAIVK